MSFNSKIATLAKTVGRIRNWPTAIGQQFRHRNEGVCELSFRDGLEIAYRPATEDWETVKEVMLDGVYAVALSYLQNQKGNLAVLDLGANIGLFSLRAAQCAPHSPVYAFEPAAKNVAMMEMNLRLNPRLSERIRVYPEAVGGFRHEAHFLFEEQATQGSRLCSSSAPNTSPITVRAFQEIVEQITGDCALAKIDVEGAEYEIFQHTPSGVWTKIRALAMEIHGDPAKRMRPEELLKQIESLGFAAVKEQSGRSSYFFSRNA